MRGRFGAPSNVGPVVPPDRRANRAERSTRRGVWPHLRAGSPSNRAAACGRRAAAQVRCVSLAWQQGCAGLRAAGTALLPIRPGVGESGHAAAATQDICDARARRGGRTAAWRASAGWAHTEIPVDPGCADHCGVDALRAIGQRQPPAPPPVGRCAALRCRTGSFRADRRCWQSCADRPGSADATGSRVMARHGMADEGR